MEKLALEIFDLPTTADPNPTGSKYAALGEDASITIADTSEIFASGDMWTYSFTLNIPANAHIFGTAGEIHGDRLHEQMNKRRARLWVLGVPMYIGYLKLDDETDVDEDGNVDVILEGGQKTFEEMIDGGKANQVPMMDDVLIGMALWRKRWAKYKLKLTAYGKAKATQAMNFAGVGPVKIGGQEWIDFTYEGENEGNSVQEYPRMVYPKGQFHSNKSGEPDAVIDCVNTDSPYDDAHPFCNIALCYQKYGYERKDTDGNVTVDYSSEPEAQRGYEYMPASRVNSAPNFYVIYWIRALMKHLGIHIDENQMMDMEDLRRLFFVNTKCAYEEPKKLRTADYNERMGSYWADNFDKLIAERFDPIKTIKIEESGFKGTDIVCEEGDVLDYISIKVSEAQKADSAADKSTYMNHNNYFHKAYATSECFPDEDISEVIKALESGFGIRLLFSDGYKRVRIVLLRNVFNSREVQEIDCDIISNSKTENSIRGFRMTYGDSEDTHFYYKGFDDLLPRKKQLWVDKSDKHDYSHWDLDAEYARIIHKISAFDKTCYVTPDTGNAYGIKIDKDAKRYDELHPSLFEFAGFMDSEDGDCTGEDETIETIDVGFKPAIMNDLNMEDERENGSQRQIFALFVDEAMRVRRPNLDGQEDKYDSKYNDPEARYDVDGRLYGKTDGEYTYQNMMCEGIVKPGEFFMTSDMYGAKKNATATLEWSFFPVVGEVHARFNFEGHINSGFRLYLQDNFEPNDDGISPIEKHDWGLMLGIMRGSGSDAFVNYSKDPDDTEGMDTWEKMPGSSVTSHPDTVDSYGNEWDYNGTEPGTGAETGMSPEEAQAELETEFPSSVAPFNTYVGGYITRANLTSLYDDQGVSHNVLIAVERSITGLVDFGQDYIPSLIGHSVEEMLAIDRAGQQIIVEIDSTSERRDLLIDLCYAAFAGGTSGGRVSLKLRAEKLNPYFDRTQPESATNKRYLEIDNESLRGRGLHDTFYKEYSYFVRNARIVQLELPLEISQLEKLDKTKRVRIGDITGFIRKLQYTVSNKTGMSTVKMEVMYI